MTSDDIGEVDETTGKVPDPKYADVSVWAIDYTGVMIPIRGGIGTKPGSYSADMIAFVDAQTGQFLFATQYDRP